MIADSAGEAREGVVPVGLPGLAAVERERLVPLGTVGGGVGPLEPYLDLRAVDLVVGVEEADAVLEASHDRRVEAAGEARRRPPDAPDLLVRVEQAQRHPLVRLAVR